MALPVSGKSVSSDTVSHDSTVANLIKFDARCECAMGEPVVATVMTCPAVAVTPNTKFKDVVNALLAGDAYAVPVVDTEARPLGTVTEADLLANLEFHGGTDAVPIFSGAAARRRWRKASALTAAELMAAPVAVIGADAPIGQATRRLSDPSHLQLCVVDHDMRLVGILTRRNLLPFTGAPTSESRPTSPRPSRQTSDAPTAPQPPSRCTSTTASSHRPVLRARPAAIPVGIDAILNSCKPSQL
jgi:CBS-domain-containing membrane protein